MDVPCAKDRQYTDLTYMEGVGIQAYISTLMQIGVSICPRSHYTGLVYMVWFIPDPVDRYSPFSLPTSVWVYHRRTHGRTDGQTDRHSSNVLEFCAYQMSPRNIGSQIIISRCYKRIDKTNLPSLRRV